MNERRYLNTKEAAVYTGWSEIFFRQTRSQGSRQNRTPGPPYIKLGRKVLYDKLDLDRWLEHYKRVNY